jgi:DNA-binding transcriptional LysR family regulator
VEIRQLKYFIEIYRTGSISLAAENLSVTQPALSQQMALLERELKTPLFERSKRGMKPTAAGILLAEKASAILMSIADIESAVKAGEPLRQISFAVGETLAAHFVPQLLVDLRRRFSGTRFRVIESNLTEIRAALREDAADFALSPEPLNDAAYINRYLIEDEIVPAVSASDTLALKGADWERLKSREWILFHPGSAIRKISDGILKGMEKKFEPKVAMELRSVAGVVHCLEAGLGVGFISNLSLTEKLIPLRITELSRRRKFYLTYKKKNEKIAQVSAAILQFALDRKEEH